MDKVFTIVLAGGRGKRMDLLCQIRPKPVLPFAGNWSVIDFTLSNCLHSDLRNIAVLVDYQKEKMANYLMDWYTTNGNGCQVAILPPKTAAYWGTADAVYQNLRYIKDQQPQTVLILAGDHVYKMDYRRMLDFHHESGAELTVGVVRVPIEQAHRFGTVTVDTNHRITGFVEKSSSPRSNLASMGIYAFSTETLTKLLVEDSQESSSPHDFGYAILPRVVKQQKVAAFEFKDYWRDIGTVDSYYESNLEILAGRTELCDDRHWPILNNISTTSVYTGNIFRGVKNSLISHGCIIKGQVENSILSPGVVVENGAVVVDSIIMSNTRIGYQSTVKRCILDEDVTVGEYCQIGSEDGRRPDNLDITVLGQGVKIPDRTLIESKCKILPGVGPAVLYSHHVAAGTVVST